MDALPKISQDALALIKEYVPEANVRAWAAFMRANPDKKISGMLASTIRPGCYCALGAGLHVQGVPDEHLVAGAVRYIKNEDALRGLGADVTTLDLASVTEFTIYDGVFTLNDEDVGQNALNLPWPAIADILESLYHG